MASGEPKRGTAGVRAESPRTAVPAAPSESVSGGVWSTREQVQEFFVLLCRAVRTSSLRFPELRGTAERRRARR